MPLSPSVLRNQLGNADILNVSVLAFGVIREIQNAKNKGEMLAGITSVFLLLSECSEIPVSELFTYTKNMMTDGQDRLPQFKAVQAFIEREVL